MTKNNDSSWIKSTCAYCGVGCGIEAKVQANGKLEVRGDEEHPANLGKLCSKGLKLGETVTTQGRMLSPSVHGEDCSWDHALSHVASTFSDTIAKYGQDSVAFYVSGQLLTEDYYVVNKLMKGFIGSANIDTNSRLCMASSVVGHKRAFGEDIVPGNYEDLELANLVILTGSNLAWCHPVLYQRLKAAKARHGTKIVVIDPRETASCEIADLHLPLFPGSDIALFNGLLAYMAKLNQINQKYVEQHTEGFDEALELAKRFSNITSVSLATGLKTADIETFFQWFRSTPKTVTVYSQGVNQSTSGTDKVNSILNCHIATGRVGQPGSTPFSITGQPNAMGGREVGGLANTLAAHMEFGNPEQSELLSEFWETSNLATKPGLKAMNMFEAIETGKIKALWVMATNPAVSLPESNRINAILASCPYVVVSDCVESNDTLKYAHVRLPAQGWSEKSGTVTNSERRISRQRRLLPTPGMGKPDWWIVSEVAKKMGFEKQFSYRSELDIFNEYVEQTRLGNEVGKSTARALTLESLSGMTPENYQSFAPRQWPAKDGVCPERLFGDGNYATPNGKGRFVAVDFKPPALSLSERYGLILNSGRIRDQWHTMTRSGLSPSLSENDSVPQLEIHPFDAADRGIKDGHLAKVISSIGEQIFIAKVTSTVSVGQCYAPIHWTHTNCSDGKVCTVIPSNTDPFSGQPEFKATPIEVKSVKTYLDAQIVSRSPLDKTKLNAIPAAFWVSQQCDSGVLYSLKLTVKTLELEDLLAALMDDGQPTLVIASSGEAQRVVYLQSGKFGLAAAIYPSSLAGSQPDISQLVSAEAEPEVMHGFLAGTLKAKSRTICTCKKVTKADIENAIDNTGVCSVKSLGELTGAGTGCGSCVAELEQFIGNAKPISITPYERQVESACGK
ncbi:Nitrate reductase [Grimontia celer]|uniref:Nitrate reductase n=1 Tax=Grimontia celer TaxID=1796497 RepID=A0A128EZ98_9GAMM|nr:nitrate reductase [Grimontia celer]CZF79595.1 Nitrate reductase [Grimontia celer]